MGNHNGCVSAPMDRDELRQSNMDKSYVSSLYEDGAMRSSSCSTMSYSASSTVESHPLPSCDEDVEYSCEFSSRSNSPDDVMFKTNLKILFLDVDGVLNNPSTKWDDAHCGIDDEMLKYLKYIVARTGCKIVLSTTWRLSDAKMVLLHTLKTRADLNIDDLVIGQTPCLKKQGGHRTHEIAEYLRANAYRFNVVSWCAVDDLSLHKYDEYSRQFMAGHFVRTNKRVGMTPDNMMQCISTLNANDNEYNPYSCVKMDQPFFIH